MKAADTVTPKVAVPPSEIDWLEGFDVKVGGGAAVTVKLAVLVTEPSGVVTVIGPEAAFAGTTIPLIVDEEATPSGRMLAAAPLKKETLAPGTKPDPAIDMLCPGWPVVGVKLVIVGAASGAQFR